MKMKKLAVAVSLACAGFVVSPATWAVFPNAGVDNVPSLAKFKITFSKDFAFYLRDVKGAPFCQGYKKPAACPPTAREFVSPMLYEPDTKVGRSGPHQDGDNTDEQDGADVCKVGSTNSCSEYFSVTEEPILDAHFQRDDKRISYENDGHPFDEGPKGSEEIHTQIVSFKLTPLSERRSANAVRAGDQAPCQARSLGEVESLNGNGFPAESVFHMYVEVDVDFNNDGIVDMVLFNKAGVENTVLEGDPLIIESTGIRSFPPKVIYQHTGRAGYAAPQLFVRGKDCNTDSAVNNEIPVGWLRIATHGIDFGPATGIKRGPRQSETPDQCMNGDSDIDCLDRFFNSLPMMPIPPEEDVPLCDSTCDINPVEIDYVTGVLVPSDNTVTLSWATASEINNAGFYLWQARKVTEGETVEYTLPSGIGVTGITQLLYHNNETGKDQNLFPTRGVFHHGFTYSHVDNSEKVAGTYYYAIGDINFKGELTLHLENIISVTVP